jgi:hypothetical protein
MMLSISSEGADSTAFVLGNGRKIGRICGISLCRGFGRPIPCLAMAPWSF